MCKAIELGKVVVDVCLDREIMLNTSKLQKLLFYMQKTSLKQNEQICFEENIIALECGPAIDAIRQYFCSYNIGFTLNDKQNAQLVLLDDEKAILEDVLILYGKMSPMELIELSRQEPSWIKTWCDGEGKGNTVSTNDIRYM